MREIKFRAWFQDGENYYMDNFIEITQHKTHNIEHRSSYQKKDNSVSTLCHAVMQYTGLKDKNGVEIYEGDIVKYKEFSYNCEIVWIKDWACFCIDSEHLMDRVTFDEEQIKYCKVIGNIYEHRHLLDNN